MYAHSSLGEVFPVSLASEDHITSFQNVSKNGVGEPGIGGGDCNRPPEERPFSG